MNARLTALTHLIIPLFVLHLLEELITRFYQTDSSINNLSEFIHFSPQITFFLIQILLFGFLALILLTIIFKRTSYFLIAILTAILLYEFVHTYEAVVKGAYVSGLITGTALGIMGLILLYTLLRKSASNPLHS